MFRLMLLAVAMTFAAPVYAAPAPNLFTISGVKVEAAAESAISARDAAMAQGRAAAWTQLFRRLTAAGNWRKQPMLDEKALERLIGGSYTVANERRSTTRYAADVTFNFNPTAVRAVLQQNRIPFTDTRSPPVLVVPLIAGRGFDPVSPWSAAWKAADLQEGLVPFVTPAADEMSDVLTRPDLMQAEWDQVEPLANRYNAAAVIFAAASEDGKTVRMIEVAPTGRTAASFAYAQSSFAADAAAVADKAEDAWKTRSAVDLAVRDRLVADVQFNSLDEWAKIRAGLAAVHSISDVEIIGLALHEAEIGVTYSGRPEQLRDALAQQRLELNSADGQYTLQVAAASAAGAP
ncbi:MAG TPA: DUF2066 domain-containing protein [Micropepsaceae bacterium]|nr:DUF2066 domain-containing protein [Micropepsaceae bacterium]